MARFEDTFDTKFESMLVIRPQKEVTGQGKQQVWDRGKAGDCMTAAFTASL